MFYKIAYAMIDYHRIEDNQALQINSVTSDAALVGEEYKIVSYNIGFAAYTPDFGFFMDGGKESRAKSEESVKNVTSGIAEFLNSESPDFMILRRLIKIQHEAIIMMKKKRSETVSADIILCMR